MWGAYISRYEHSTHHPWLCSVFRVLNQCAGPANKALRVCATRDHSRAVSELLTPSGGSAHTPARPGHTPEPRGDSFGGEGSRGARYLSSGCERGSGSTGTLDTRAHGVALYLFRFVSRGAAQRIHPAGTTSVSPLRARRTEDGRARANFRVRRNI